MEPTTLSRSHGSGRPRSFESVMTLMTMATAGAMVKTPAVTAVFFSRALSMPNDYSTAALQAAVTNGLLKGSGGKLRPAANLTRAEMATILNHAFGATEKGDISGYTDVPADAWYANEMAVAVHMKTLVGSGKKLNPSAPVTRQEALTALASVLKLPAGSDTALAKFADSAKVASWAKSSVAAMTLTLNSGASFTVPSGTTFDTWGSLNINGTLTVNGSLIFSNGTVNIGSTGVITGATNATITVKNGVTVTGTGANGIAAKTYDADTTYYWSTANPNWTTTQPQD